MNTENKPSTQHFYLRVSNNGRLTKKGVPIPENYLGAPVGVIAFQASPNPGCVVVAASMVSRKDMFVKKTGVAKALGRLKNEDLTIEMPLDEFRRAGTGELAARLGLCASGNYFTSVNWTRADLTKASAIESFEARQAQSPA